MTAFSLFKYVSVLKEKNDLSHQLEGIKQQITVLENEKQAMVSEIEKEKQINQQLFQENSGLKENLNIAQEKLAQLDAQIAQAKDVLDRLNSAFTALRAENIALKEQESQFKAAIEERDALKERMNSVAELKKMIKELKYKMRQEKRQVKRMIKPLAPKKEKEQNRLLDSNLEGNQGFVVKEGQSTYQVRIEVNPIEEKNTEEPKVENINPEMSENKTSNNAEPAIKNSNGTNIQPNI